LAGLIQASDGNLYGTTHLGGTNDTGTVFKITPGVGLTTLYSFSALSSQYPYTNADGYDPRANLLQASDGNLYGTNTGGGAYGCGTVFKITTGGAFTTLHSFSGPDGDFPQCALIQATDGNLYGTTYEGGANGNGTVFRITTGGTLTTLYSFSPTTLNSDGLGPEAGLIQASDGNLYGTASQGGANGEGTIFKITPGGFTTLYTFSAGNPQDGTNADGSYPVGRLIQATDGNLYGTTVGGGASADGTVFKITTGGTLTSLHSFSYGEGLYPYAGLIQASDGNLYGTNTGGGASADGTVFKITMGGALTVLYSFGFFDGGGPYAGLLQATDGNLYGTTLGGGDNGGYGTVFRANGIYPQPNLLSLSPGSRNAGAPAFTLTVNGTGFQTFSTVNWNGAPLSTTFVSDSVLKATVPASLLAAPGHATVTVVTGAGGGTSNAKSFTIPLTTLTFSAASLINNSDGTYTAQLTLKNTGYQTATNVMLTQSTLGAAATSTSLPLSVGSLAPGATASITLTYPASAGTAGSMVIGKASGTFTGGTFSESIQVTLP
jgi:uncharacterized repeat protein (TIGR03803 family)